MPTLVKERPDSKPASTTNENRLAVIVLLLGIAVIGALLGSVFPLPPDAPSVPNVVPPTELNFFAP
jgi:hypothetical protein